MAEELALEEELAREQAERPHDDTSGLGDDVAGEGAAADGAGGGGGGEDAAAQAEAEAMGGHGDYADYESPIGGDKP
jgi:hypothetical protein